MKNKKLFAILATVAMLAGMLAFGVMPAAAGTGTATAETVAQLQSVSVTSATYSLGYISISGIDPAVINGGSDTFYFELQPNTGLSFMSGTTKAAQSAAGFTGSALAVSVSPTVVSSNICTVGVTSGGLGTSDSFVFAPSVYENNPADGNVTLLVWDSMGLLPQTQVVAGVIGSGSVNVSALSTTTIAQGGESAIGTIQIQETMAGAFDSSGVTLTLPTGYGWDTTGATVELAQGWGSTSDITCSASGDELTIVPNGSSSSAGIVQVSGLQVTTPQNAALGDLTATLGEDASGSITLGTVGTYGVAISGGGTDDIYTAQTGSQSLDDFYLTESLPGSLIGGRTVTFTLSNGLTWDVNNSTISMASGTNGAWNNSTNWDALSLDSTGTVLSWKVPVGGSLSAVTLDVCGAVYTTNTYTGPVTVTVGGNAGVGGTVTAAEVALPVTLSSSGAPNVTIGSQNQAAGDVTIAETGSDDFSGGIALYAPAGVSFTSIPTVTVTSGDIQLGAPVLYDYNGTMNNELVIPITETSNTASTIKVSGINLTLASSVPTGNVQLGFDYNVAYVTVANAVTATAGNASFTIGATVYTVGGVTNVMDVAPFISNGRTYVPVRYLANALGADVAWDGTTNTVTITKGDNTITMTIGSNVLTVNGVAQTMDVAPQIVNGRTMLPARWVAQALGAQVGWNPVTQQVMIQF